MQRCTDKIPLTSATAAATSMEGGAKRNQKLPAKDPRTSDRKSQGKDPRSSKANNQEEDPSTSSPWDHGDRKQARCIPQQDHSGGTMGNGKDGGKEGG